MENLCGGRFTLKKKMEILWVDDQISEREEDKKNIIDKQPDLKIDLIHPVDFLSTGFPYLEKKYDLYLIDIRLNEFANKKTGKKCPFQGSTIDSIIREKYPDTLIYGLSQDYTKIKGDEESFLIGSVFDRFFDFKEIKDSGHIILYHDAIDFQKILKVKQKNLSEIFKLLCVPDEYGERLKLALPASLKNGIGTLPEGTCQAFSRWVQKVLLKTPGFLYNELYTATYLGLSLTSFKKIEQNYDLPKAQYSGVFSKSNESLWWVSSLNQRILSDPVAKTFKTLNPWEISPKIFGCIEADQTKCIICDKLFPERIGINISDPDELAPVHIRCSKPYPGKEVILYFDEYRGFTPK